MAAELWDVLIVGGGPAGLSAALTLGRCRRRVLLCDDAHPRNRFADKTHGFLTRDGEHPLRLLELGRAQLQTYGVELRTLRVLDVERTDDGEFHATLDNASRVRARRLLLATGLEDELPPIEGLKALYGRSVFHCPYCDGWEVQDSPLGVLGANPEAVELALALTAWTDDVVLLTQGEPPPSGDQLPKLRVHGIPVETRRIAHLEGHQGQLRRVRFVDGDALARRALFFHTRGVPHSSIPVRLGCRLNRRGCVLAGPLEETNVPGVFVAGDLSRDVQLLILAAAEGAKAAVGINRSLREEDTRRRLAALEEGSFIGHIDV